MPTKIFTILGGDCPFGRKCAIDSPSCRQCPHFYRAGTATFFWCKHPDAQKPAEIERKPVEIVQEKRKRGRPPGKSNKTAKKDGQKRANREKGHFKARKGH